MSTSRYSTAEAVIETVVDPDGQDAVTVMTIARYHYNGNANAKGRQNFSVLPGGKARTRVSAANPRTIATAWGQMFDLAAGIQQNRPRSVRWILDLSNIAAQSWAWWTVEAISQVTAAELDIPLSHAGMDGDDSGVLQLALPVDEDEL